MSSRRGVGGKSLSFWAASLGLCLLASGLIALVEQARVSRFLPGDSRAKYISKSVKFCETRLAATDRASVMEKAGWYVADTPSVVLISRVQHIPSIQCLTTEHHRVRPPPLA